MSLLAGMAAGAVGTTALNVVTYLDVLIRARPSSGVPAKAAAKMTEKAGIDLSGKPGEGPPSPDEAKQQEQTRQSALGALMGYATGIGIGAVYGLIRPRLGEPPVAVTGTALGLGAMAGSDVPSTAMGVTDPRTWGASGWMADIVPHLAYGVVTALAYEALDGSR